MRKDIMYDGNSYKIRITKKEMKAYSLKVGDIIEIGEIIKVKSEGKK